MNYPLPRNHFRVEWGGTNLGFCEVSGLTIEMNAPGFRDGVAPVTSDVSMPGQVTYPALVLKRAVVKGDNEFFQWMNTARFGTVERRDVIISLLDGQHNPVVIWKFKSAFPIRLDYSALDAECSRPLMEILEIRHDGMTVEHTK